MTDIVGTEALQSVWEHLALSRTTHPFLIFQDQHGEVFEFTYGAFNDEINKTANLFLELGVSAGEMVALHMHTCPEFMMCLFGLAKIGAVAVPLNEQNLQEECRYVLDKCSVTCAVVEECFIDCYQDIAKDSRYLPKGIIGARLGSPRNNIRDFKALKAAQPRELSEVRTVSSDDIAEIIFTSGTTSCPKGVILTHANMVFSGLYGNWEANMRADDRLLTTMPACHSNFQLAALTPVLTAGATLIVVEKYSARKFWEQVCSYRATLTQAVAMMVRTLLMQPISPDEKNHCLREVLYFLPLTAEEKEAFEKRFALRIMNTYGSTESVTWVITDPPNGQRKWPAVGRVGLSYEAKIVDEQGAEVPHGEIGEIWVKGVVGRTIMKGYFDDEAETARVLDEEGWLRTDDKGYQDESGWFYFVDRSANMIKRAGENISTTELESILVRHPLIAEAAVIGIPDPIRDQAVKAFVLPKTGASLSEDMVLAFCKEHMASFKVPSVIEIVEFLPRTCSLKIEKKLLK
ncbi:MAG: crotonobetaine/carnitine-CoA ligase [Coriobacteriaceae bacterium]|jgi:crotonobetaine/carnitine-CoA ligase|nr:crotonobetaine/carnitine-CoA ligase [Coriobacteriaceae bacterium]